MSSIEAPVACARLLGLIDTLGEDAPDQILTHKLLEHLATCPTCCRDEAALTCLLADFRFAVGTALPAGLEQRLVAKVCGEFRACE